MNRLAGKRVAFTGKLASMTRVEAADLVQTQGGAFVASVTRRTSFLVLGQEGWPLKKDGSLSEKLETARCLQAGGSAIEILSEEEFLQRLGLEDESSAVRKRFTLAQLGRLLKVPRDRLRSWMKAGLVKPIETIQGVCYFDFQQVTGVRTLWELAQSGVTFERMCQSLAQLARWFPGSLTQLNLLERNGQLFVRLEKGQLSEPSGQLHLDFQEDDSPPVTEAMMADLDSRNWWERGCELEDSGQLQEAARAYREALYQSGPDAWVCFNLGNVLYALGQLGQAAERFRQAVELEHGFFEAWNNLGNVLIELGQMEEALSAYRQSLSINPAFADAHYNLADALEQAHRYSEARRHWKEYIRLEPMGEWAEYARKCLALRG